jgi:hypothetical protein
MRIRKLSPNSPTPSKTPSFPQIPAGSQVAENHSQKADCFDKRKQKYRRSRSPTKMKSENAEETQRKTDSRKLSEGVKDSQNEGKNGL